MVDAGFPPESIELLRRFQGKIFKSYECEIPNNGRAGYAVWDIRINLGRTSYELFCDYEVFDYFDAEEEMTRIFLKEVDPKSKFMAYAPEASPHVYMVDEVITEVQVIHDRIEYRDDDYVLDIDMGIALKTKYHTFVFSRSHWFLNLTDIRVHDGDVPADAVDSLEELWFDGESAEEAAKEGIFATREVVTL